MEVIDLHEALERLARTHPRPAQVVELRFFGRLSVPEVADTLEVSVTTVESDWRFARAWLRGQLGDSGRMRPECGQRIHAVFEAALKSDPDGRAALLEELCAGDPELRAEVERLLVQDAKAERDGFLATPASTERDAPRFDGSTDGESEFHWARSLEGTSDETPIPAATPPPGLAEHPDYEIKRRLGRGGMGLVYLAENRLMGRNEVLKVLGRQIMERPGSLERFLREIRAVAKLRHPQHRHGVLTPPGSARASSWPWSTLTASTCPRSSRPAGRCPWRMPAITCTRRRWACSTPHEHGMVHRDIKPSNLMLDPPGRPRRGQGARLRPGQGPTARARWTGR